jgi:outer membrane receptor protein involved in Fe transport
MGFSEEPSRPYDPYDPRYYPPDSTSYGKKYFDVDTTVDYRSKYNILYGTARYIPNEKNIFTVSGAWQKRWWDLRFPKELLEPLKSIYDLNYDQYNANAGWRYSGIPKHMLKTGFQIDYTKAKYNIIIPRIIHEFITTGSTNFEDVWGPLNGDTGTIIYPANDFFSLIDASSRTLVKYQGFRNYYNYNFYVQDSWEPTEKLTIDAGARVEASGADTSVTISPRLNLKYNLTPKNELIGSIGHYTQNNYNVAALALSEHLTPEKTWHISIGSESKILPWLTQKVDIFGKYYYDLLSEMITADSSFTIDDLLTYLLENRLISIPQSEGELMGMLQGFLLENSTFNSRYINDGKGVSYGFEYFLRFEPSDFWHGWIALTLGPVSYTHLTLPTNREV